MKDIPVKSEFAGRVYLRDFEVKTCIDNNESIKVRYGTDTMILTPDELVSEHIYTSKNKYKSKIKGLPDYHLYGYRWLPDEIEY